MFAILQSLDIDFQDEYSPEFIQPMKYDFYFIIGQQQVIVEMDGGFHNRDNKMRNLSLEDVRAIDDHKTQMVIANGIDLIRIDCDYKRIDFRYQFIKDNILKSRLSQYLSLDAVDFDECNNIAITPEVQLICTEWNSGTHDMGQLRKMFHITQVTLSKYLRAGEDAGICTYNHTEYKDRINKQNAQRARDVSREPVLCLNTNEIFSSGRRAKQKYGGDFSGYFTGRKSYCGKHPTTGESLHWKKLTLEEERIFKDDASYTFIA